MLSLIRDNNDASVLQDLAVVFRDVDDASVLHGRDAVGDGVAQRGEPLRRGLDDLVGRGRVVIMEVEGERGVVVGVTDFGVHEALEVDSSWSCCRTALVAMVIDEALVARTTSNLTLFGRNIRRVVPVGMQDDGRDALIFSHCEKERAAVGEEWAGV